MDLLTGFVMEELKEANRDVAMQYIEKEKALFFTQARCWFGILRATMKYKRNRIKGTWTHRFDDVELLTSETDEDEDRVSFKDRWFAKCLVFVKIGDLEGAFIHSYAFLKNLRSYPDQTQDLPILHWWPESDARNRDDRLQGDIIHIRVVPIQSVKDRVCIVPDWSHSYLRKFNKDSETRSQNMWKLQRFLLNSDYMLF